MTHKNKMKLLVCIVGALGLSLPIGVGLMSKAADLKPAVITQADVVAIPSKEWVKQQVPLSWPSGVIIFSRNGDAFLAGRGRLFVSRDHARTWSKLEGGEGHSRFSVDGGATYENSKGKQPSWIDVRKLCSVDAGAISDSGRLYLKTTCEHTGQLWSIPTNGEGDWFVTDFIYRSDPSDGVYGPRSDLIVRRDLIAVTGNLPGGWAVLTTQDKGFSWKPLSKLYDVRELRGFDFTDATHGVLLRSNGELLMTSDGGKNWKATVALPAEVARRANTIRFAAGETLLIAGDQGMILSSKDKGVSWRSLTIEPSINWYHIVTGQAGAWISGNSDVVLETRDFGATWLQSKLSLDRSVYSSLTSDGKYGWAVDEDFVLRSP